MDNSKSKVEISRKPRGKKPGSPKTGGRVAGVPNKTTGRAREAFALLVENNVDKMQGWIDEVATDPKHGKKIAFDMLMAISEYHIPKLARTEHVGDGGGPVEMRVSLIEKIAARRLKDG
jgi:hypothetical protein